MELVSEAPLYRTAVDQEHRILGNRVTSIILVLGLTSDHSRVNSGSAMDPHDSSAIANPNNHAYQTDDENQDSDGPIEYAAPLPPTFVEDDLEDSEVVVCISTSVPLYNHQRYLSGPFYFRRHHRSRPRRTLIQAASLTFPARGYNSIANTIRSHAYTACANSDIHLKLEHYA